jgi:DNA-directed RNA polymerase specialized sigma24 family protein
MIEALRASNVEQIAERYGVSQRTVREWRRDAVNELRERTLSAA